MPGPYYVDSAAGGTASGADWTNAFTTLKAATDAATAGEYIYVKSTHSEAPTAAVTYVFAGTPASPVYVIVASDTGTPPTTIATGAVVGGYTGGVAPLTFQGSCYVRGMTFKTATYSTSQVIKLANTDDDVQIFDTCRFEANSGSANGGLEAGTELAINSMARCINCDYATSATTNQGITLYGRLELYGGAWPVASNANINPLFKIAGRSANLLGEGVDFSGTAANALVVASATYYTPVELIGCKLGSGALVGTISQGAGIELTARDCASGDTHYAFAHYNYQGNTVISTSKYVTADGASYDGTNKHSWEITGVNATRGNPYMTPWIDAYIASGTITPYIEILTTTADSVDTDAEVYAEFEVKSSSGSPRLVLDQTNRASPLAAGTEQTAGTGYANWTGASSSFSSYKLDPSGAITVAGLGYMRARICLTKAATIWADPQIRGLS